MDNLYPEIPDWFKAYLISLSVSQKNELIVWINHEESGCALDSMQEVLEG